MITFIVPKVHLFDLKLLYVPILPLSYDVLLASLLVMAR